MSLRNGGKEVIVSIVTTRREGGVTEGGVQPIFKWNRRYVED